MKNSSPISLSELAGLPLHEVMPKLRACIENLSLEEVAALVRPTASKPPSPRAPSSLAEAAAVVVGLPTPGSKLAQMERAVIDHVLAETANNVTAAARLLGIDRKSLERKIARYRRA